MSALAKHQSWISDGGSSRAFVLEQLEDRIVLDGAVAEVNDVLDQTTEAGYVDNLGYVYVDNGWWYDDSGSGWWYDESTGWFWNENDGWWFKSENGFDLWYRGEHQYWAYEISTGNWLWYDDVTDQTWEPAFTWFAGQLDSEWTWVYNDWNGSEYYFDELHHLYQDHYGGAWWWFDLPNDNVWEQYKSWFTDSFGVQVFNDFDFSEYLWGDDFHLIIDHAPPTNDAPVMILPSAQTIDEDTYLRIPDIYMYDVDAGGNPVQVTISAQHGVLSLYTDDGLSFSTGDGTEDAVMIFEGTWSDINTAFRDILYTPGSDYCGSDTVSVAVNDLGNSGPGDPQSISDAFDIQILPAPDLIASFGEPGDSEWFPVELEGNLYFRVEDGFGWDLWVYVPGVGASVVAEDDAHWGDGREIEYLTVVGDTLYFGATDSWGYDLWKYEPGGSASVVAQDEDYWGDSSHPMQFTVLGGNLYFTATDGTGNDLWVYQPGVGPSIAVDGDATTYGNHLFIHYVVAVGDSIYFSVEDGLGYDLWVYQPGVGASVAAQDETYWGNDRYIMYFTVMDGNLYFRAPDSNGYDIWVYQPGLGTANVVAQDESFWGDDHNIEDFIAVGSNLYFWAPNDSYSVDLWVYQPGSVPYIVAAGETHWGQYFLIGDLTAVGDNVFFYSDDGDGYDLWVYQPGIGAHLAANDSDYWGDNTSTLYSLTAMGDRLYWFVADSGWTDSGLWEY